MITIKYFCVEQEPFAIKCSRYYMNEFLRITTIILLVLFIGMFSVNDYLHASHSDEPIEGTAHQHNSQERDEESNCDCLCICHISPLNMESTYNHKENFTHTFISIQQDLLPPTPFLNLLERPPQTV